MEIMFDMERHPWCFTSRYFRRDPFSKQFEIVFRARDAFTVCVPLCICLRPICYRLEHFSTHTDLYENKGTLGGGSLWRAKTEFLLCSWTVPRRGILLAFVPVTFRDYLTQRRSNVFDNKFDDSILVVHFENSIFFNLIQILFAIKHFVNEKLLLLFLYWNLELEFY